MDIVTVTEHYHRSHGHHLVTLLPLVPVPAGLMGKVDLNRVERNTFTEFKPKDCVMISNENKVMVSQSVFDLRYNLLVHIIYYFSTVVDIALHFPLKYLFLYCSFTNAFC